MNSVTGLLVSQIGYDTGQPKRAIARLPAGETAAFSFVVVEDATGREVCAGVMAACPDQWGSAWRVADFSGVDAPGTYRLIARRNREKWREEGPFAIGPDLLWQQSWRLTALEQSERRQQLAKDGLGWYDAGTHWQEADSHVAQIMGLCDLLEFRSNAIGAADRTRIEAQIVNGCDYLAKLQDMARDLPDGGDGALVHQSFRFETLVLPGDAPKAALAFALAARLLSETHAVKEAEYRERAHRALRWFASARPYSSETFSRVNHGFPPDAPVPDEWPTREWVTQLGAMVEMALAGGAAHRDECAALASRIIARQILKQEAEDGYFGHFRLFDRSPVSEKAWVHNGDKGFGADIGGHFPHYLLPLLQMAKAWPDHPNAPQWEQAVRDFAYGYFQPACRANPFLLLPLGYFQGEGLLWFAGSWHGISGAYGLAAALALEFERHFGDPSFREIAVGNLQWIAGLNSGLTKESLFASHVFYRDVPPDAALPVSLIQGVGRDTAGGWMQFPGAICNGFSAGQQFQFDLAATAANDAPSAFTDEDWISHGGAWLSALARL